MAYLDKTGLTELWKKVKSYVDANGGGTPTTITGNAGTATKLQTTRAIDGVNFNGTADIAHYAVCYTTGSTAAKTVSLSNFKLAAGARVFVRFSYANTAVKSNTERQQYRGESRSSTGTATIPANLIRSVRGFGAGVQRIVLVRGRGY